MAGRLITNAELDALFAAQGQRIVEHVVASGGIGISIVPPVVEPTCAHCWHSPRVWQGPLPVPRHCCWCGVHEGPQHGPYAEG